MKFRIGYRTIKTAVGAMISIMLAQYLGLGKLRFFWDFDYFMY